METRDRNRRTRATNIVESKVSAAVIWVIVVITIFAEGTVSESSSSRDIQSIGGFALQSQQLNLVFLKIMASHHFTFILKSY